MPTDSAMVNGFFMTVLTMLILPLDLYLMIGMVVAILMHRRNMDHNHGIALGSAPAALLTMLIWPFVVAIGWS
jgi:hypothetical protein